MNVYFHKHPSDRYTLECRRDDGTTTSLSLEARSYFAHDLMHAVVERRAGTREGFFGAVAAGKNLAQMTPQALKTAPPASPLHQAIEIIVTAHQGAAKTSDPQADLRDRIAGYLEIQALPIPEFLTPTYCAGVLDEFRSLLQRWSNLRPGGSLSLELTFPG